MKKIILACSFVILLNGICFSQSSGSTMYVAVKTAPIKSSTGFFASTVVSLNLGDAVTVVSESGKWLQVRTSAGRTGWAVRDSFSTRRVVASGSATASEVALAGKGFSAEAETEYRRDGLDYSVVDVIERQSVPMDVLERFIIDGRLRRGE
jgi:uncharacterized protein YgiM (DUF1202 family)